MDEQKNSDLMPVYQPRLIDKKALVLLGVFSLIFAFAIVLGGKIVYSGDIYGDINKNYINPLTWSDMLLVLPYFAGIFAVMICLCMLMRASQKKLLRTHDIEITARNTSIFCVLAALFLFICWLPYLLSNLPAAIFSDAYSSILQALGQRAINNHHPILYTLGIKVLFKIGSIFGGDINTGLTLYTVVQTVAMAGVLGYTLAWMYKRRVSRAYIAIVAIIFAFFPLFPFYAIAMWKDTYFSLAVFLYSLFIFDIFRTRGENIKTKKGIIGYCVLSLLVMFLRNNGIYIVVICTVLIIFLDRKRFIKRFKGFFAASLSVIMITAIIQFPVYNALRLNTEFVENVGIPLQQVARVVALDGNMTEEQRDFIAQICPIEEIKAKYNPCIVDSIKWYAPNFSNEFLENHKLTFIIVWFKLFWSNKRTYIDAFLLQNAGFWSLNFNGRGWHGYIQVGLWNTPTNETLGIKASDKIQEWFGFSFMDIVKPIREIINEAIYVWIFLVGFVLCLCQKNKRNAMAYVPSFLVWLAILIATPIATHLRYIFMMVLMIPLIPVIPAIPPAREEAE